MVNSATAIAQNAQNRTRFDADVPVELITRDPMQPRKHIDPEYLDELAASIAVHGVIQPLVLRPNPSAGKDIDSAKYIIVAGERRWRAAQLAGVYFLPAVIRTIDEGLARVVGYVENLQREDLTPMEDAWALSHVVSRFSKEGHAAPQQAAADFVGKSRVFVTNLLRLLSLSEGAINFAQLHCNMVKKGHLMPLVGLGETDQMRVLQRVVSDSLSARDVERMARRIKLEEQLKTVPGDKKGLSEEIAITRLEQEMSEIIGGKLQLERVGGKWEVHIHCHSMPEVEGILERLGKTFASEYD